MKETADAVVIGGGINGCSIAYELANHGVKRVVLLERRHIAGGPTGRSSGVIRQHYTIETLARMAFDSLRVFQNFGEIYGGSAGFVQVGDVFLVEQKEAESLRTTVTMHQRIGIRSSVLTPDELRQLDPLLDTSEVACGAYEPDGGYADPALAANSICDAARAHGVAVKQRCPVVGLTVERGQIKCVKTTEGEIATETVVNVAGPWGSEIAAFVGVEIPITPSRHPVVLLQRPPRWRHPTPVWVDLINAAYFKPEGATKVLVGSIRSEEGHIRADTETYSQSPSYDEIASYSDSIMKRFPVMSEGLAQGGWAGLYDVTPDWQPVIDHIPDVKGFYCAVGFSGHGFKLGPAVGTIMGELILEGSCKTYDISPFRYERFREGRLTRTGYEHGILG
ncbi:MAG: FAD-binding oxidoreductase [Acidobacteria bacterium]|nr:FAD-binding oxidoreductase [Acidobacteriota bacterium]